MRAITFLSALILSAVANGQVHFIKTNSLDKLFSQAKGEGKYIFIDAYTDWCGWCKVLDKKVFATREIGDSMNKYFVSTKFEMEKDSLGILLSRKYGIQVFPTGLILSSDGQLVYVIEGYSEADSYWKQLREAMDPARQLSAKGFSNSFNDDYAVFYKNSLPMPSEKRKMTDSVTVNDYFKQQADLTTEQNWVIAKRFYYYLSDEQYQRILNNAEEFKNKYGTEAFENFVESVTYDIAAESAKAKNKSNLNKYVDLMEKNVRDGHRKRAIYEELYYEKNLMWEELAVLISRNLSDSSYAANHANLNQKAWAIYEHTDNKVALDLAAQWMAPVIRSYPDYAYIDTYAALLYKLNRLDEAKKYAEEAIVTGKREGENVGGTEELLAKINKARIK